jgi:hypothetical protein
MEVSVAFRDFLRLFARSSMSAVIFCASLRASMKAGRPSVTMRARARCWSGVASPWMVLASWSVFSSRAK